MRDVRWSTVRSRELGHTLRLAMEHMQLSGSRVANRLGWSQSRVSRLLTGKPGTPEVDVSSFLALCEITGDQREFLLSIAREHRVPGWLQKFGQQLPKEVKTLVNHESRAVKITDFEAMVVPGLLQTSEYAQALLERSAIVPASEIQDRVDARITRQSLFNQLNRPQFTFYIHELVLRLPVGGPQVMSDQLHHLLRMSVRTYISLRIVPAAVGAHPGCAGSCRLMEFADIRPVAYVEELTSGDFMEEPEEIAAYRKVFGRFADIALDEEQSRQMMRDLAVDLYGDHDRDLAEEQL